VVVPALGVSLARGRAGDAGSRPARWRKAFRGGAEAGHCPAGLLSSVPRAPLCAAAMGGCVSPVTAVLCSSWGGVGEVSSAWSPHVGCGGRVRSWGLLAWLTPPVACSWGERSCAPPGAQGDGGGRFVPPALPRGGANLLPHTPPAMHRAERGASQPGSGLLRKRSV